MFHGASQHFTSDGRLVGVNVKSSSDPEQYKHALITITMILHRFLAPRRGAVNTRRPSKYTEN